MATCVAPSPQLKCRGSLAPIDPRGTTMHLRQWPWLSLAAMLALTLPGMAQPPGAGRPHHRSTDDIVDFSQIDDEALARRLGVSRDNLAEMHLLDILRRSEKLKGFDEKKLRQAMQIFRQNPKQFQRFA